MTVTEGNRRDNRFHTATVHYFSQGVRNPRFERESNVAIERLWVSDANTVVKKTALHFFAMKTGVTYKWTLFNLWFPEHLAGPSSHTIDVDSDFGFWNLRFEKAQAACELTL